ncbi:transient receptor potential channel pyrexia-like [Palaemon carinicauda]|uniref:transient receptor potential channel pyrexia-like n=1 Tax=Palaemon carinicauda TaxID=392227 RepID=UPI0035B6007B
MLLNKSIDILYWGNLLKSTIGEFYENEDRRGKKYCSIHYAAHNGNGEVLKALLKANADVNVKEGEFGRSALHILANRWKTNEDAFKDALDILLSCKKIKVDISDSNRSSPLFIAATKGWEYMVRALILKGANTESTVGNKTTADIIRKKLPGLLETIDFSQVEKPQRDFGEELYDALKDEDLELFKNILNEINSADVSKPSILEGNHGEYYSLLEYACDNGLSDFAAELLKNGANPSLGDESSPILYATRNGYHKIVEMLIGAMKDHGDLEKALRRGDGRKETPLHKVVKKEYSFKKEGVDYYRCLQLLLDKKRYLDIDALDEFHNTPLHYAVLGEDQSFVRALLLNGSHLGIRNKFGTLAITRIQASVLEEVLNDCIKYKNNVADRDFEIILHYSLLAPAEASQQPETECLRFLSGSKKHRRLLLHPIIDTFLFLKWQRIRQYYFFNILAYTFFVILLTAYILIYHGTYVEPLENSVTMADNNSSLNATDTEEGNVGNFVGKFILQALIALLALYIAVREGVQFCVSWWLYITRIENWLEISIVVLTVALLFIPMTGGEQQCLSAWLILFSWIEFILILGRHPYLAVYVTMFTTVTYNFLKFIVMFSFMIIAFSISFYLVFQMNESFETYHQALLKTIAMTTGEMEYTDLPLSPFPVSSHLLFVVFVFLIVLVLMNLLNGLAVSDIQQIQQEAEIVSYSSRVELISYIESVFLASPFQRILPGPITCCDNGAENCYFAACLDSHNPAMKLLNWMGRRTLMFHSCLRDRRITVYPNRGGERWHICDCHKFHIKEAQIEAAKDVVLEKESSATNQRLSGLENRLDEVMAAISSLTDKVDKHVLCPSPQ